MQGNKYIEKAEYEYPDRKDSGKIVAGMHVSSF